MSTANSKAHEVTTSIAGDVTQAFGFLRAVNGDGSGGTTDLQASIGGSANGVRDECPDQVRAPLNFESRRVRKLFRSLACESREARRVKAYSAGEGDILSPSWIVAALEQQVRERMLVRGDRPLDVYVQVLRVEAALSVVEVNREGLLHGRK